MGRVVGLIGIKVMLLTVVAVGCSVGIVVAALYPQKKSDSPGAQTVSSAQAEETKANTTDSAEPKPPTEAEIQSMDQEVKNAASSAVGAVVEFISNNNGRLPTTDDNFASINQMLADDLKHPVTKQPYVLVLTEPKDHELYYAPRKQCADDNTLVDSRSQRMSAVQAKLVSGALYCVEA